MKIDQGRIQRFVSHEIFDGQQIRSILIEMGAKNIVVDTDGRDSCRIQMDGETLYLPNTFFICVTK